MKSVGMILALFVVAVLSFACNQNETSNTSPPASSPVVATPTATPDELATARIHFQKNCVECHGERGDGGPKEVDGKRFRVPSLREGHALNHTDEKFMNQITAGDEEMPAFKDKLTQDEIKGVVKFIRKEFQGK